MRKVFQSSRQRLLSKKRAKSELAKRRKNKIKYTPSNQRVVPVQFDVKAPRICSLINNPEGTLNFFKNLDSIVLNRKAWANVDFGQVTEIGYEVLLYLLSRMDHYRGRYGFTPVKGNFPADPSAAKAFKDSGFYKFVKTDIAVEDISTSTILTIRNGFKVQVDVAHEIREFAQNHIPGIPLLRLKQIYRSVIECMANTNNHAYQDITQGFKWWLICKADPSKNQVHFIFLDNGQGIPKTVKKKFFETLTFSNDWEYVSAALEGRELRSRTGKPERGKGLPSLNKQFKSSIISNLCIISRKGYLDLHNAKMKDLEDKFFGTLLTWGIQ